MCNDFEQHIAWAEYCRMMESLALKIPTHQTELDLPQADDIRINDPGQSSALPAARLNWRR